MHRRALCAAGLDLGVGRLGIADEDRRGARSVTGAVALVNVPAINGGVHAAHGDLAAGSGVFASPRDPRGADAAPSGGGGKPVQRKNSFSRAFSKGHAAAKQEQPSATAAPEAAPAPRRRGLVRSLSFGHDAPKRAWGSAAA